jgi:SpoVK/Ycf46/Vps4 family AAA+-type ATPase
MMDSVRSPLFISTRSPRQCGRRAVTLEVTPPSAQEQVEIWKGALASIPCLNGAVTELASQFTLTAGAIESVAAEAQAEPDAPLARLWDACRVHSRPRLEGLAQRIEPAATWDQLVLPEKQLQTLRQIAIHVRRRAKVYQSWGFASQGSRGLGISAVFAGPSGTGKTMAAEVLANELRLDLFRIDLSQVVSKYIGETEKNLRRVFDAADAGAAILLFDEADALFGKRSEVKDSHDRFANIEISYLLQRMETYRGLAVLTTNRKSALDQAFLRRIRFAVEFPFPEASQRAEIWRRVFPGATPTEGLRIDRLAQLNAAGGHIRNIAMGAAFLAADADEPVRMSHLLSAARSEFAKLERPLTDAEVAGWV